MPRPSTRKDLPYFKFFVKDWLTSNAIMVMTPEQKGAYIDLLCHAWLADPPCTLHDDDKFLAKASGLGRKWKLSGTLVRDQFEKDDTGKLVNPKLLSVWLETVEISLKRSESGTKGGMVKAAGVAIAKQMPSNCLSTGVAIAIANVKQNPSITDPDPDPQREKRDLLSPKPTDDEAERAGRFLDRYPQIYAKVRSGALYVVKPVRDYGYAVQLTHAWTDDRRLDQMAELFLHMSPKEALNRPGTVGQFLNMAPECDARLRENGR